MKKMLTNFSKRRKYGGSNTAWRGQGWAYQQKLANQQAIFRSGKVVQWTQWLKA